MKTIKIPNWLIVLVIMGVCTGIIVAYSTYGAPSEFGNETTTTCYVGGDPGNINCTGVIKMTGDTDYNYFAGHVNISKNITTVETIHLKNDIVNHRIYDNTTCIIITGSTSILNIC